ncbi:HAD family hydrolase [Ruegeria profundi]|uniref:phosphoglycolate phosphatase n=1 Tax=Ruegeria profundi TaxID=1685378 RepID=A0A0X3TUA5_9RHOB|nr:HAD family hydrolase [Ruegeria profundi]KUJ79292.1 phosphatase [Ruegeria profundi]
MPIDAILFDKDGTLFDFADTWGAFGRNMVLRLAQGDHGRAAQLGRAIGFDLEQVSYAKDSVVIAGTIDEIAEVLAPHLPNLPLSDLIDVLNVESASAPQAQAVPLVPFFNDLRQAGLKLGVATNDGEMPALRHLESVGIRDFFDFVAGYDSGHGFKPGPGQLLAFSAHVDVTPERVAMVGDSLHDLQAGRAAGMTTVAVLTGMAPAEVLAPWADVVLPDIGHIPDWLARI